MCARVKQRVVCAQRSAVFRGSNPATLAALLRLGSCALGRGAPRPDSTLKGDVDLRDRAEHGAAFAVEGRFVASCERALSSFTAKAVARIADHFGILRRSV